MNVTLRQWQAFVAVADAGNFTRAAQRMRVAQSAISVLVRDLEDDLGIRLFDRTTRRVELTDAGIEFRGNAEKLIADLDHAIRHTHDLVERRRGRITVAAPPFLATALLPTVMAAFYRDFPGVRIVLMDARTDQILARVKSGEADIGVGTFSDEEDGLIRTPLGQDKLMLFCHSTHALAGQRRPKWSDLKALPLITLTRESTIRSLVDRGFEAAGLSAVPAYEVSQITTALALVEADLGVSVLPTYSLVASRHLQVASHTLSHPVIARDIVVIARDGHSLPPATGEFIKRLQNNPQPIAH